MRVIWFPRVGDSFRYCSKGVRASAYSLKEIHPTCRSSSRRPPRMKPTPENFPGLPVSQISVLVHQRLREGRQRSSNTHEKEHRGVCGQGRRVLASTNSQSDQIPARRGPMAPLGKRSGRRTRDHSGVSRIDRGRFGAWEASPTGRGSGNFSDCEFVDAELFDPDRKHGALLLFSWEIVTCTGILLLDLFARY